MDVDGLESKRTEERSEEKCVVGSIGGEEKSRCQLCKMELH
jgi:hypothetical protein